MDTLQDTVAVTMATSKTPGECLFAAFMAGAQSGMVEIRGYGLTRKERVEAAREAYLLYAVHED